MKNVLVKLTREGVLGVEVSEEKVLATMTVGFLLALLRDAGELPDAHDTCREACACYERGLAEQRDPP